MTKDMQQMLIKFKNRFEEIKEIREMGEMKDKYIMSVRMAALMTDMENAFQIPIYGAERIEAFKRAFPGVIKLYREISFARDL